MCKQTVQERDRSYQKLEKAVSVEQVQDVDSYKRTWKTSDTMTLTTSKMIT